MNVGSAELVFGHVESQGAFDQRRTTGEQCSLRGHHREVSEHHPRRDAPCGGSGGAEHERHFLTGADVGAEHVEAAGQVAVPVAFGGDVGARAFVEDDQRYPVLARHVGQEEALEAFLRADVRRSTRDGEVLAANHDRAAVDLGQSADVGQRREVPELAVFVCPVTGQPADLVEAARVDERVDAVADGQLAQLALAIDAFLAAHLEGELAAEVEFIDFGLPVGRFGHRALLESARST